MIAKNIEEAASRKNSTYIGGGTDIMPLLKNKVRNDQNLVFVGRIPEMHEISETENEVVIGAGTTLWDIANSEIIKRELPAIAQAAGATASPQIRNIGTIGGNVMQDRRCIYFNQSEFWRSALPLCYKTGGSICHQIPNSTVCRAIYYSDVATALIAYDAQVEYYENGGKAKSSVEALVSRHVAQNGYACQKHLNILITSFIVPKCGETARSGFYKYAMRATIDFPLINFALVIKENEAKIVCGAVSTEPVVLLETSRAIIDAQKSDDEVIAICEKELIELAKPIKEALISPQNKRDLYKQIYFLLYLRN